jgi:hypothetical protein
MFCQIVRIVPFVDGSRYTINGPVTTTEFRMHCFELSYAQNKNRGEKMRLLGMDTCPRLNDIMEINKVQ